MNSVKPEEVNPDSNMLQQNFSDEENEIEAGITQSYKTFDLGSTSSGISLHKEYFERFKETVFSARQTIGTVYNNAGSTPLYTYTKNHIRENRNKTMRNRKPELISTIHEQVRKILGSAIADSVARQLKTNDSVSTVQKTTPLSHPDTLNATLMNAVPYFNAQHPSFANVIVLSCAGISFNNTKFPRGHIFHTSADNNVYTNILTFFGHTVDSRPVLYNQPYSLDGIQDARNSLQQLNRDKKIDTQTSRKILQLLDEIYSAPHPLSADDYVDQLTITNYHIFKMFFANYKKQKPNLIYLSQEKLALALLLDHHMEQETLINRILFDESVQPLIEKYFDGLTGAFVLNKKIGSYLFWGIPKSGKYRIQLWRDGKNLKSEDGTFNLEMTPDAIRRAIINKQIFPSVLLSFIILAMYYGLLLGGGYEQTFYLTKMKERFIEFVRELQDLESEEALEGLITTNLVIPRPLFTYIASEDARIPATGLDMLLYGDQGKSWNQIIESTKRITLGQLIERTLPSLYREYVINKPHAEDFATIYERDIEKFNGLDKAILPMAQFGTP